MIFANVPIRHRFIKHAFHPTMVCCLCGAWWKPGRASEASLRNCRPTAIDIYEIGTNQMKQSYLRAYYAWARKQRPTL